MRRLPRPEPQTVMTRAGVTGGTVRAWADALDVPVRVVELAASAPFARRHLLLDTLRRESRPDARRCPDTRASCPKKRRLCVWTRDVKAWTEAVYTMHRAAGDGAPTATPARAEIGPYAAA
jgi:hypothetical protein